MSDNSCKVYKEELEKQGYDATRDGLHEEVISNTDIQKIVYLEGEHYLHWKQSETIADMRVDYIFKYVLEFNKEMM